MSIVAEKKTITKDELERSVCRDSFYAFLQRFWDIVVPEDPVWNWHIEFICNEMQKVAERVFQKEDKEYDLLINVPPGSTKSTICSVMFPAWVWTRMETAWCICGSYSYALSMELSRKSRDIIESEKYLRLFGNNVTLRVDQNTKGYFVNEKAGGRYATSTGGSVTGYHAHFLIIDDPLNPQEAVSETELLKANDWIGRTLSTRKKDKGVTATILIMQRLHEDDPAGKMVDQAKTNDVPIRHINLPAEIDETNANTVRPRRLKHRYVDGLMDPVRMSRKILDENRTKLMEYSYAGQFLQNPVPIAGGMFKVGRIHVGTPPYTLRQRIRFWDKAGTEGGGAYTVGLEMAEDMNGEIWILDVIREQLDTFKREDLIKNTATLDGTDVVVGLEQEPASGGKESAQRTVLNLKGHVVEIIKPNKKKEGRALAFSSQVNAGMVHMVKGPWNDAYIHELSLFPKGKYKDQVDASSGGFTVLTFFTSRVEVIRQ